MIRVRSIEHVGGIYRTLVTALRKGCKSRRLYIVKASTEAELNIEIIGLIARLEKQGIKRKD